MESNLITITVNKNGKDYVYRFTVQSDEEIEKKLRKIQRRVKWWGGVLIRVLINRGKADAKLTKAIERIITKL